MGEKQVFDKKRVDEAIEAVCVAMDELELTMFERWFTVHCVEAAARGIMGEKFSEIAEKYGKELGIEPETIDLESSEASSEPESEEPT